MKNASAEYRAVLVQAVFERRDDAEVAAPSPDAPKQIRIFTRVRDQQLSVRGDDIGPDHVVERQAVLRMEMAPASAKRQSGDSGSRNDSKRRHEPKRLSFMVEFAKRQTGCRARRLSRAIDPHPFHARKIDHQSGFAHGLTGDAVASAA